MKRIIITAILSVLFCHNIFTQDIEYIVRDISYLSKIHNIQANENFEFRLMEEYDTIAGPIYGYSGSNSDQWIIYIEILQKYSNEIIEVEYYQTNSIALKIYLYWIMRERNWINIEHIYNDLLKYKNEEINFAPGGCIVLMGFPVEEIINNDYKEYQEYQEEIEEQIFQYLGGIEGIILPDLDLNISSATLNPLLE